MNFSKITEFFDRYGKVVQISDASGRVLWRKLAHVHSFLADWVIDLAATCTAAGSKHRVCSSCGQTETETIPATGHTNGDPVLVRQPTCTVPSEYAVYCAVCTVEVDRYVQDDEFAEHIPDGGREITAPTCTEKGVYAYQCRECDAWLRNLDVDIPALGHEYVESVVIDNTCTTPAIQKYACFRCNAEKPFEESDIVRLPLGHAWGNPIYDVIGAYEPTCAIPGYAVYVCSVCKAEKWETVPATGKHVWGDDITYNGDGYYTPTCTDPGFGAYVCANCGGEKETIVPALGHDYDSEVIDPTCEDYGYTLYTCRGCGDTYTSDSTEPTGHNWGIGGGWHEVIAATCTDAGKEERECLNCTVHESREIPATGHSYESIVTEPTCENGGYTTHTCSKCNDSYTDSYTSKLPHSWTDWYVTKHPTCDEDGTEERTCPACGTTETEPIEALNHKNTTYHAGKAATCTEDGYTGYNECDDCGKIIDGKHVIKATGHTEKTVKGYAATCTATGLTDGKKCTVCGTVTVEQKTIPALGHTYKSVVTKPTCTTGGYTTHTCTVCGHSYTDAQTEPNGHNFVGGWQTVTAATCTHRGSEKRTCLACGHTETREVAALGHDWGSPFYDDGSSSGQSHTCERCGETEEYS